MITLFHTWLDRRAARRMAKRSHALGKARQRDTLAALRASPPAPIRDRAAIVAEAAQSLAIRRGKMDAQL
jgi:hypothetical protein